MFGSCYTTTFALLMTATISTLHAEAFVVMHELAPHRHTPSSHHLVGSASTSFIPLLLSLQRRQQKQLWSPEHDRGVSNTRDRLNCCVHNGHADSTATRGRLAGWRKTKPDLTQRRMLLNHRQCVAGVLRTSRQRRKKSPLVRLAEGGESAQERVLGGAARGGGEESNALLLRVDFEDAEIEELRQWIRR